MYTITPNNVCIIGKPEVRVTPAIQFTRDGAVVGTVEAIYDFSTLDPKYHALALTIIQSHQMNVFIAI